MPRDSPGLTSKFRFDVLMCYSVWGMVMEMICLLKYVALVEVHTPLLP